MKEMIVEAFLGSLFGVVLDRLASSNFIDYFRIVKLDTLVEKLESILNSINQVLDDAEKKQYENPDVKKWLGDVKHAMYDADQLLDEIATDAPLKKLKAESQPSTSNIFNIIPAFANPFESRIKELITSLDSLAEQKDMFELKKGTCARNELGFNLKSSERLPTTYLVDASSIYGRDEDKDEMIKILLSKNGTENQVPVISIVGLGGMGKTTFAKLVFNDHLVEEHFELKAWVYVPESFDVVGLTKAILKSFDSSAYDESIFNLLQKQLQQILSGKKYLLVLDDIWNRNGEIWEQLLIPFNHGSSGSKIIVTTRDKEVAYVLKSTKLFDLQQLGKNDCWSLFATHAFHGKNVCEHPYLESIGREIVDKCGGLPLAIKTLGQLLRKKFSHHEWIKLLETNMWRLQYEENNINPVLRLSYHNLPSNRKRCFAYCSIFPKGYRFDKGRLIMFWMAEGLLKCCGTYISEEELGNEIFGDLESISFIQQTYDTRFGSIVPRFIMHDLVNDLAKSVSGEFCMQIGGDGVEGILERTRHILGSLQCNCDDKILERICELKGLRSLILQSNKTMLIRNNVQHYLFSRLKYLRMLSFRYCFLSELVDEISNLKLLRYLDLSYTKITSLPDTICLLYNLQTLLLQHCCRLTELPSNFSNLINLRNLELPCIEKMPKHIGKLKNLQTLNYFIVEERNRSELKELAKLNHLHGTIHIKGLDNVIDPTDVVTVNLKDKKYLEEILMEFDGRREEIDDSIVESNMSVLEAFQPNINLKKLTIEGYNGSSFPNWLRGSHLPPLGQLPSLKELCISNCKGIKVIGEEFYGNSSTNLQFRSLEVLQFSWMNDWEEWVCGEGFPLLKKLFICNCPKLKRAQLQHLPFLQNLEIRDCNKLEASIPKVDSIIELDLRRCDRILVNELPTSLKRFFLWENRYTEFSVDQNLSNIAILEGLVLDVNGFVECPSLCLRCYNSLCHLSLKGYRSSTLPFSLNLFTNLHYLELLDCPELELFPRGSLPSNLRQLSIWNCSKLISLRGEWGLFQLNTLKNFSVNDEYENVKSFPEEKLLPPNLYSLGLYNCSQLRILNYKGFVHLKSLDYLYIKNCPNLECLPEEGLPNSLSTLYIINCPLLKEKYQREGGERWHTISHIPCVEIDGIKQE